MPCSNPTLSEAYLCWAMSSALLFISIPRIILSGYRRISAPIFEPVKHPASIISPSGGISSKVGKWRSRKRRKYSRRTKKFASEIHPLLRRVLYQSMIGRALSILFSNSS